MNEDISLEHILNSSFTTLVEINAQYKEVTEIINDSNGINSNVAEDNIQNKTLKLCQITTVNQQDNIYEDSEDYNNDPDYDVSNDSDDESNISISESFDKNEKSNTTNDSLNTSKYEEKANCDDTNLIVLKSQEKGQNKKYFCKYCKKLQTKFARHLETVHKNEEEVKKFILLPKESEVTELANFMGHDKSIHKSHYRQSIPELDIPRFSRLLNLAIFNEENDNEDGEIEQNLISENLNDSSESSHSDDIEINNNIPSSKTPKKKRSTSPFGPTKRKRWTQKEIQIILTDFSQEIEKSRLPSGRDIETLRQKHSCLQKRTVPQIKTWLHNIISGKTKIPKI
ncbi:transcription factor stalky-like [Nylanderia fulva]|uniref:transcription factor stalky-like n=1 Tax=Nylanderia fulva TaxID=613905 RepID=UPI0010FAEDB9|nr:transcription factor stalky-like [Nylanderia fulva]